MITGIRMLYALNSSYSSNLSVCVYVGGANMHFDSVNYKMSKVLQGQVQLPNIVPFK